MCECHVINNVINVMKNIIDIVNITKNVSERFHIWGYLLCNISWNLEDYVVNAVKNVSKLHSNINDQIW